MGHKRLQVRLLWLFLTIIIFSPLLTILVLTNDEILSDGQNDINFSTVVLEKKTVPIKYPETAIATKYKAEKLDNNIEILGRTLKIVSTNTTETTPNTAVAQYFGATATMQGKFFFAHNSANLFSGLNNLALNSTFRITKNGLTTTYQVKKVIVVPNDKTLLANMTNIAQAHYEGINYSVALMTCAGTSYGNGNATHRVLVFANAI